MDISINVSKNNSYEKPTQPKEVTTKKQDKNHKNVVKKGRDKKVNSFTPTEIDDEINKEKPSAIDVFKKKGFPIFNRFSDVPKKLDDVKVVSSTENVFASSGNTFKDLDIHPHTVVNLERIGKSVLTAVQEKTIPIIMGGKNAFVRSQTGSGKTLAYAVPIVELLRSINPHISRNDGVQAVVVVPTRELALQTFELFLKLVEPFRWIVPGRLCGGENRNSEKARLRKGINILVGTPGRLLDHMMHTQNLRLDRVRCLVLDEADRLLDMGFQKDINKLVQLIDESKSNTYDPLGMIKKNTYKPEETSDDEPPLSNPRSKKKQTILLSATLTNNVKELASFAMDDYVYIDPLNTNSSIPAHADVDVVVPESVRQMYIVTDVKAKLVVLSAFIVAKAKKATCKMFVFMASRQMVEFHEALFKKCLAKRPKNEGKAGNVVIDDEDEVDSEDIDVLDVKIYKLHGSMEQKERVEIFKAFRVESKAVLLCTDVAARGVDVPEADYVVQYTGPLQDDDYIHRVGRTGRAGHKGHALLFLTEPELEFVNHLREKKLNLKPEIQETVLKHLKGYMQHITPGSAQMAAEELQRRYEKAILTDRKLQIAACFAYSSWSRYYSSCSVAMKKFFDFKTAHLGHYVTSFGLRMSPQEVGKLVRSEAGKLSEKKHNKNLSTTQDEQDEFNPDPKPPKRSRTKELMISEFDSGLEPIKKKKKVK